MITLDKPAVEADVITLDMPEPELQCDGMVAEPDGSETRCPETVTHRAVLSCGHHYLICDGHVEWCRSIMKEDNNLGRCGDCPGGPWVNLITLEPIKG